MRLAVLAFVSACTPAEHSIGPIEWTTTLDVPYRAGFAGRNGEIALIEATPVAIAPSKVALFEPTGVLRWQVSCDNTCIEVAVDSAGNVLALHVEADGPFLRQHAAADGAVGWSQRVGSRTGALAVTADDTIWYAHTTASVTTLEHFTNDGSRLGSAPVPGTGIALSIHEDPGGVIVVAGITSTLATAFANDLTRRWTVQNIRPAFAAHGNGELSVIDDDFILTRLDINRSARWRGHEVRTVLSIARNWTLASRSENARTYYELVDPDGDVHGSEIIEDLVVVRAPELPRFFAIDEAASTLVARRLEP
jgi:hypothetical protein